MNSSFTNNDCLRDEASDQMSSNSNHNYHEAKKVKTDHPPSVFRFLDLHAELRNSVYEYAVEDKANNDTAEKGTLVKKTPTGAAADSQAKTNHARVSTRVFFGLTQVSRQIRSEYRPMYLKENMVCIEASSIPDYVETFYPTEVSHPDFSTNYEGNIAILIEENDSDRQNRINRQMQIKPLLRLIFNNENVHCTFPETAGASELISTSLEYRTAWKSLIDDGVEVMLELKYFHIGVSLTLTAADEFWDQATANQSWPSFMATLGLDGRSRTHCRVGGFLDVHVFPPYY